MIINGYKCHINAYCNNINVSQYPMNRNTERKNGSQGLVNGKAHKDVIFTLPLLSWLLGAVLSASRCHTDVLCAMRMPCEPLLEDLQEPRSTKTKRASNILGLFSNEVCSTRCTSNNLQQKKRWWLTSTFPSFRRTLVSPSTQVS